MLSPCLGLYYLLPGLHRIMGEMYAVSLSGSFTTSFQTLLDNGGDGMLSPCLGLYYLLSGLRRIMGEMNAVSLSGSLLPAFRPCWILGEMGCCLLVWASQLVSQFYLLLFTSYGTFTTTVDQMSENANLIFHSSIEMFAFTHCLNFFFTVENDPILASFGTRL